MNKKTIFLYLLLILAIASCTQDNHTDDEITNSSVVGNKVLVDKMQLLYDTNLKRDLNMSDLDGVEELISGDDYAEHQFEELSYLISKKEDGHASHIITNIEVYAATGKIYYCMPHELAHIRTYMKYNDEKFVQEVLDESDENLLDWQIYVKERQKTDSNYFSNYNTINIKIIETLKKLKSGDRSKEIVSDIYYIEQYGLC